MIVRKYWTGLGSAERMFVSSENVSKSDLACYAVQNITKVISAKYKFKITSRNNSFNSELVTILIHCIHTDCNKHHYITMFSGVMESLFSPPNSWTSRDKHLVEKSCISVSSKHSWSEKENMEMYVYNDRLHKFKLIP